MAQFLGGLDRCKEGTSYHLNRLAVECTLSAFGGVLQRVPARPLGMCHACRLVRLHTHIPDLRGLSLSSCTALEEFVGQIIQVVDVDRVHALIVA